MIENASGRIPVWKIKLYTMEIPNRKNVNIKYVFCRYDVIESVDGNWGMKEANGSWNGMVGMILRRVSRIIIKHLVAVTSQ